MTYDKVDKMKEELERAKDEQLSIAKIYSEAKSIAEYKVKIAANGISTGWPIDPYLIYFWFCNRTCPRSLLKAFVYGCTILISASVAVFLMFLLGFSGWLMTLSIVVGIVIFLFGIGYFESALDFAHSHLLYINAASEKFKED